MPRVPMSGVERVGAALLVAFAGWAVVRMLMTEGSPTVGLAYVLAPAVLVAGYVLGRAWLPRLARREAELVLGFLVATLVVGAIVSRGPAIGPLGYANANAAAAVQAAGLAALLAVRWNSRLLAPVLGLASLATTIANRSLGGMATGVIVLVALAAALAGRPRGRVGWLAWVGGFVIMGTGVGVVALAGAPQWPTAALAALDRARQMMWSDAWEMWRGDPLLGRGPGWFAQLSRLGSDADTATAHSSLLQVGAETGLVGVALLSAIIVAGFVVATRTRGPSAAVAIACWTALWTHSLSDHLIDFPAVVVLAGAVLGWAVAGRPAGSEQLDVAHREHP